MGQCLKRKTSSQSNTQIHNANRHFHNNHMHSIPKEDDSLLLWLLSHKLPLCFKEACEDHGDIYSIKCINFVSAEVIRNVLNYTERYTDPIDTADFGRLVDELIILRNRANINEIHDWTVIRFGGNSGIAIDIERVLKGHNIYRQSDLKFADPKSINQLCKVVYALPHFSPINYHPEVKEEFTRCIYALVDRQEVSKGKIQSTEMNPTESINTEEQICNIQGVDNHNLNIHKSCLTWQKCPDCDNGLRTCPLCRGAPPMVLMYPWNPNWAPVDIGRCTCNRGKVNCNSCNGSGKVLKNL